MPYWVSEDLHFDVLGLLQELFHKDVIIAEGLAGLVPYQLKVPGDLLGIVGPGACLVRRRRLPP